MHYIFVIWQDYRFMFNKICLYSVYFVICFKKNGPYEKNEKIYCMLPNDKVYTKKIFMKTKQCETLSVQQRTI